MSHDDFSAEPDPAAAGQLPAGEHILWQGSPDGLSLAWRVYHLREVTGYFSILMSWRAFSIWWETALVGKALTSSATLLLPFGIAALLLLVIGFLSARTTRYTITNKRLVMRTGIAMPGTLNLPFSAVKAASHRDFGKTVFAQSCGDVGVEISEGKLAYLMLWPHVRPWQLRNPQPMMRCLPNSAEVAEILVKGLSGTQTEKRTKAVSRRPVTAVVTAPSDSILSGHLAT
jgi:Bacterial PH domain